MVRLSVGGGSRLKILESIASGVPVVSTLIGAEGLELSNKQHYFSAHSILDLGYAIVGCIRDYTEC